MSAAHPAKSYLRKSEAALKGAHILLKEGDTDGACSRAYYAMFEAAHAALFSVGIEKASAPIKTHNGLIASFGKHVVLENRLAASHGEALNAVQRLRQLADYTGDTISLADATWAVAKADEFVDGVKAKLVK